MCQANICKKDTRFFTCQDEKYCIRKYLVCDGYAQCEDESGNSYSLINNNNSTSYAIILDEDPNICSACPHGGNIRGTGLRTYETNNLYRNMKRLKYANLSIFSCKHNITKRPICAIPCNGAQELCEGNEDEECQGPGLLVTLVTTFVLSAIFISTSLILSYIRIKKLITQDIDSYELRCISAISANDASINLFLKLSLYQSTMDIKNGIRAAGNFCLNTYGHACCDLDWHMMEVLGTNGLATYFYDCVERSMLVKVLMWVYTKVNKNVLTFLRKLYIGAILIVIKGTVSLCLRYSDLSKDLLFLYMIWLQLGQYEDVSFPKAVFIILAISLVMTEISNMLIILQDDFKRPWRRRICVMVFAPLMPAYYIYEDLHIELSKYFLLQAHEIVICRCQNLHLVSQQIYMLDKKIWALQLKLAKLQCNENILENVPQLTILLFIILLNHSSTLTVDNLQNIFMDENSYIGWGLSAISIVSIIKGQINFLAANKNGCLRGIFLLILFHSVGLASR